MSADPQAEFSAAADALIERVAEWPEVRPDLASVLRVLDIRPDLPRHAGMCGRAAALADELPRLARPCGIYRIDHVRELTDSRLTLSSGAAYTGAAAGYLHGSERVATFLVTIGRGPERLSRMWLRRGRTLEASIVDAWASECAEAATERCHADIRAWAHAAGYAVTSRFSPGYCGLSLAHQRVLFQTISASRLGVRLTESCLMLPIKSVSGLIGIGPARRIRAEQPPCVACDHPACRQRRAPCSA